MGAALPKSSSKRTAAAPATAPVVDAAETVRAELRAKTDYEADSGYAPLYHAVMADLPRLSSGQVCTLFLLMCNMLSYGRPNPKRGRHVQTEPITAEKLALMCRCHVRDIQRQLRDLAKPSSKNPDGRGLIAVKMTRRGEYIIELLYRAWPSLPDYVSGPKVVEIGKPETGDDEAVEASADAVRLVRRPQTIRSGRACRAIPVKPDVHTLRVQYTGPGDLVIDPVVDKGGALLVAARVDGLPAPASEDKANVKRHGCREDSAAPAVEVERPKRADEVIALFDPLLQRSGSRLLVGDRVALKRACTALGDVPHDFLVKFVMSGDSPRAGRPIGGPRVVESIIKEAVANWRATKARPAPAAKTAAPAPKRGGSFVDAVNREAKRRLDKFGRI